MVAEPGGARDTLDRAALPRVVVIGGYGVFGGRLARRLARHADIDVVVAGRSLQRATAHCRTFGGIPARIDVAGDLEACLRAQRPDVVVDAAGPFQAYGADPYRVARAAMAVGAHYLDLADDAAFAAGIETLDHDGRLVGRTVLSGCSSVPAISAAAVHALRSGLQGIDGIESVILPGNRAPRGRSVVEAILAQVGRPLQVWQGGVWREYRSWTEVRHVDARITGMRPLARRPASVIGVPDLVLFPAHFGARSVRFRAGLELWSMHYGLAAIACLVRLGVLGTANRLARPLIWIADRLQALGSDRGGMTVEITGRTGDGVAERRRWTMIAEAGDGPEVPPTPAYLLGLRLLRKTTPVAAGARPCLSDLTLGEIEAGLSDFEIRFEVMREPILTVFEAALGRAAEALPAAVRDLHDVHDRRVYRGRSSVERGSGLVSRLIASIIGFPAAGEGVPVEVDMQRIGDRETWVRQFGSASFRSHLSAGRDGVQGEIVERFGPLVFSIDLEVRDGALHYPITEGRVFGLIPLPRALLPISETREYVDEAGRAAFDVAISMPLAGFIVRYRGWLRPVDDEVPARPPPPLGLQSVAQSFGKRT